MKLAQVSDSDLVSQLITVLAERRRMTADVVVYLGEVEARRLHLKAAASSMFDFCQRKLGMSEGEAYRHIVAARTARRFPMVLQLLHEGRLHLTRLARISKHLTADNHAELLTAACGKTKFELEELMCARFPKPEGRASIRKLPERGRRARSAATGTTRAVLAARSTSVMTDATGKTPAESGATSAVLTAPNPSNAGDTSLVDAPSPSTAAHAPLPSSPKPTSHVEPAAAERYRVQFTVGSEFRKKLERALNLMSHRNPRRDLAAVVEHGLDLLLEKLGKERLGKMVRSSTRGGAAHSGVAAQASSRGSPPRIDADAAARTASPNGAPCNQVRNPRAVPRRVRRQVFERDGEQCGFVSESGERCPARAFLELDHRTPRACGGSSDSENIRVLCRAHNRLAAEEAFGRDQVERRIDLRQRKLPLQDHERRQEVLELPRPNSRPP